MVAIAVVGGMLVFVFSQDFFTQTDSMTGPTIELLQIVGYDARDVADDLIRNHEGAACAVNGVQGGTMAAGDVFSVHVRNLGGNDIILSDVRVYGFSATAAPTGSSAKAFASGDAAEEPDTGEWTLNVADACAGSPDPTNVIGPGRDASVFINYSTTLFGDAVKVGRPVFVTLETGAGNVFSKTVINGRSVG